MCWSVTVCSCSGCPSGQRSDSQIKHANVTAALNSIVLRLHGGGGGGGGACVTVCVYATVCMCSVWCVCECSVCVYSSAGE